MSRLSQLTARGVIGGLLWLAPLSVGAQATPPRDSVAQQIEGAVISARRSSAVVGGAAAVVVRPDSMRMAPGASLGDVLRTIPLLLVRQNSRGEAEISARGADGRQAGVLLNGLPLSFGWDGRADVSLVPMSGVTSVAFTRGLGTLLAGPNTLGGVVELQLDDPVARSGWDSRLSVGTDQTGARQTALSSATSRRDANGTVVTARAGASYRQRDGFTRAGGVLDVRPDRTLRVGTDLEQVDGFAHLSMRRRNGAALGGTVTSYSASRGVAPELHVEQPRFWRYPDAGRTAVILKGEAPRWFNRAGITQLEASVGQVRGRTSIEQFGNAGYDAVTGTEAGDERSRTGRMQLKQTLANGATISAAATRSSLRYAETLNSAPSAIYRQVLSSVGVESTLPLGVNTLVGGGVVLDQARIPEAGGRPLQPDQSGAGWRLGGTTRVSSAIRVHASASERARFPALRELYSGALNRFEPNPELQPERLLVTEAGVTVGEPESVRGWSVSATAFRQQLRDGIVRIAVADRKFQRVNQNTQVSTGLESMLSWRGGVGRPSVLLDVVAQRVRIDDLASSAGPTKPEHQPAIRGGLDALLPLPSGLIAGANLTHQGSQFCVHPELGRNVTLAAQSAAGLTLERQWRVGGWKAFSIFRLLGAVDNVSNAALYEQCGLPRAGRTFRLSISLR